MKLSGKICTIIIILSIFLIFIIIMNETGVINNIPKHIDTKSISSPTPVPLPSANISKKPKKQPKIPKPVKAPEFADIYTDIFQSDDQKVYIVGNKGVLLCFDGKNYNKIDTITDTDLYTICGDGKSIYIAGRNGFFSRYREGKWNEIILPFKGKILDSIAFDEKNVFLCGSYGAFFHYNGTEVKKIETDVNVFLRAMQGTSPENIYLVGGKGNIIRFDGYQCKVVFKSKSSGYLKCIHIDNKDKILVAGENGSVIKYNGKKWESIQEENFHCYSGIAKSKETYYICEENGYCIQLDNDNSIKHFPIVPGTCINAIYSLCNGKIMAAGENNLISLYNESSWEREKIGKPIIPKKLPPSKVKTSRIKNSQPTKKADKARCFICCIPHLKKDTIPDKQLTGINHLLFTIAGASDSDILTAGKNGITYHYNGKKWKKIKNNDNLNIYKIVCFSPSHYYACCENGTVKRFNGKEWQNCFSYEQDGKSPPILFGIWGTSPNNIYAVGEEHTILHYNGKKWRKIDIPNDKNEFSYFYLVWGLSSSDIYLLGDLGELYHYDGKNFRKMNIPTKHWLMSIWGTNPDNLNIVGEDGTFYHWNGTNWKKIKTKNNCIFCIKGNKDGSFHIVGYGNCISRYSNKFFKKIEIPNYKYISDFWVSPTNKIYLVGAAKK